MMSTMPPSEPSGSHVSSLRVQITVFTVIRTIINTMHRMVYPFLPAFSRGLGVDLRDLSLALTSRSIAGAFGPLLASISDSRGRKSGLLLGLTLFTSGVALVVIWPTYPMFFIALILTTLGKHVYDPTMQAYLGDRVPYKRRSLALAVTELSWSLSFIVGIPLIGFLIARHGWIAPFPLIGFLGLASIVLIVLMIPHDHDGEGSKFMQNIGTVVKNPSALTGLSIGFLISGANEVVNLVFGVWMEGSFGLRIAALGAASAVIGVADLSGEFLVGGLTDRLGKSRAVGLGLIANILAALGITILGGNLVGALVWLFLFYITFEFTIVSSISMMTEILPSARATYMALSIASHSMGRAFGALISPSLFSNGMIASAMAAVVFNTIALIALRRLWKEGR